jgi:hypothetical protein
MDPIRVFTTCPPNHACAEANEPLRGTSYIDPDIINSLDDHVTERIMRLSSCGNVSAISDQRPFGLRETTMLEDPKSSVWSTSIPSFRVK